MNDMNSTTTTTNNKKRRHIQALDDEVSTQKPSDPTIAAITTSEYQQGDGENDVCSDGDKVKSNDKTVKIALSPDKQNESPPSLPPSQLSIQLQIQLKPRRSIKAVTFDLDDTIWDGGLAFLNARRAFYHHLTENFPKITHMYNEEHKFQALIDSFTISHPEIAHNYTAKRRAALTLACTQTGYDAEQVIPSAMETFLRVRNEPVLYPSVISTLEWLNEQKIQVGAITNGNADVKKIPVIAHLFSFSIRAEEVGASKPHRSMFEAALRACSLGPHEVIHVGDDYAADVVGAKQVGMWTVWLTKQASAQAPLVR